jgi:sigma-B regulation protein RsbU (phosphoserine phosphatase)
MLANQVGFAMLEARNYDDRQEEAWMTTVLLEVAKHAAQPGDTMVALQAVLQLTTLLAGTDWALLLLPDESGDNLWIGVHAGFRRQQALPFEAISVSMQDFNFEPPQTESESPVQIDLPNQLIEILDQSVALCLKLTDGNNLLGLLLMQDNPLPGIRPSLLAGIGHQVSLRLENARLIEEAALRRSLERELMMARSIQSSFLPESMPSIPGWELASAWEVAREVGGDFYDVIPLPPNSSGERFGIVIADVADKGIPAALYMALCRTMLRSVAQTHVLPGRTLEIVNQQLISDTRADLFVSVFYAVWEPATAKIIFSNAGHLPPFLFKSGNRAELIREHGMVLGVMPEAQYTDQILELAPGDLLVLYTDGVSEAQNSDHELFGFQRLESLILSQEDWNAEAIASAIVDRVVNFSGGHDFSDDLTTVTMRRMP